MSTRRLVLCTRTFKFDGVVIGELYDVTPDYYKVTILLTAGHSNTMLRAGTEWSMYREGWKVCPVTEL